MRYRVKSSDKQDLFQKPVKKVKLKLAFSSILDVVLEEISQ
jgi:hypothetical protein